PLAALGHVARLAVPSLAEGCIVHLVDGEGAVRAAALAHDDADPRLADALTIAFGGPGAEVPEGVRQVVTTGRPERLDAAAAAARLAGAFGLHASALAPGVRALRCVPMHARGRVIGTITLVGAGGDGRPPEGDTVLGEPGLAEDVAERAGLAIDNLRLLRS